MPVSGWPIVTTTVQHVTDEDYRNPDHKVRIDDFNMSLAARLDDTNFVLPGNDLDHYYQHDIHDIPLQRETDNGNAWNGDLPVDDDVTTFDNLIGATFLLDPVKSSQQYCH
jgi:hypothetical protein